MLQSFCLFCQLNSWILLSALHLLSSNLQFVQVLFDRASQSFAAANRTAPLPGAPAWSSWRIQSTKGSSHVTVALMVQLKMIFVFMNQSLNLLDPCHASEETREQVEISWALPQRCSYVCKGQLHRHRQELYSEALPAQQGAPKWSVDMKEPKELKSGRVKFVKWFVHDLPPRIHSPSRCPCIVSSWTFSSLKGQERENPHDLPDDLAELLRAGAEHLAKTHLSTSSNRETDLGLRSKHQRIPETNEQAHPYWGNAGNTHLGIWNTCNVACQLNVV